MDYIIPNLRNACKILNYIASDGRALCCHDIVRALGLPRTSVLRILETLASESYLYKEDGKYSLGNALANLGNCTLSRGNLLSVVETHLSRLTALTGETSHFGVSNDEKILIARVCESPLPLHAASRTGTVVDAYCSSTGKVILASIFAKDASVLRRVKLERRTSKTIVSRAALERELKKVEAQGFAVDDEEYHEGVRCIAVPVRDKFGTLVGAIGITAPECRFTIARIPEMFKILRSVGDDISKRLM